MLTSDHILRILRESTQKLNTTIETHVSEELEHNHRTYSWDEFAEFKRDLIEAGNKTKLLFLEYVIDENAISSVLTDGSVALSFKKNDLETIPVVIESNNKKINLNNITKKINDDEYAHAPWVKNENNEIILFVILPYQNIVSNDNSTARIENIGPVRRLIRLLAGEKKEIGYIIFYACIIGLISLILPLGIQTTIELISGGVFFSSIYVLIGFVIFGVLLAGVLQMFQISLVEHLQRRIFTKAAFEFAYRIPRLRIDAISKNHAPELVNRFFDVVTIQKGLPKFLIDLSSAILQIFFGLLLLSLYHPFFIFFSLVLVTVLAAIFYFTGRYGLESSINESKYKYKVVFWFEELARAINSFKLAGNTDLPFRRTDHNVSNYLKYRKKHFNILIKQFSFIVLFKGIITGGLLIMGTLLVVDRQITLGQFVASEIIIILILNAVEKLIMYMDVVYDLLTAVEKISHITDLPLDKTGGVDFPSQKTNEGYRVETNNLKFKYSDNPNFILNGITLNIKPGERVCISGTEGSGRTTLTDVIAGLHQSFEGAVTINNYSLRDLDLTHLRNSIAKSISPEDIFDGTILENITLGKSDRTVQDAIRAIEQAGLSLKVNSLPEGLNTHVLSGGKGLSNATIHRLILARCLAKNPKLIILTDFFSGLTKTDKLDLIQRVINPENKWTLITESNDPLIMSSCDRVIVMHQGAIKADGKFEELLNNDVRKYFE